MGLHSWVLKGSVCQRLSQQVQMLGRALHWPSISSFPSDGMTRPLQCHHIANFKASLCNSKANSVQCSHTRNRWQVMGQFRFNPVNSGSKLQALIFLKLELQFTFWFDWMEIGLTPTLIHSLLESMKWKCNEKAVVLLTLNLNLILLH